MGYLDHSTNNIIIDAVLTDYGRQKLAGTGNLGITQYAFADNEIDYTIIRKYGTVIGKEKIEKNTPIMEASTNSATTYSLLNSNASALDITSLPVLSVTVTRNVDATTTAGVTTDYDNSNSTTPSVWYDVEAYGEVEVWLKYDKRFITPNTTFQFAPPAGITDPEVASVFAYVRAFAPRVPNQSKVGGSVVFSRNADGSNLTSILTNNTVSVPVTAIAIGSGLRKTAYINVSYVN